MDDVATLRTALDQAAGVLERVDAADLARPTPCSDWDVATLVDHLLAQPGRFATMMRGGKPDWSAAPPHVDSDWAATFRASGDDLLAAWQSPGIEQAMPPSWQCAELSVHTWDLARALGVPVDGFDQAPAEAGLEFMTANLKPEMRAGAFGPEQPAPPDAPAYDRIAAFAGRTVA